MSPAPSSERSTPSSRIWPARAASTRTTLTGCGSPQTRSPPTSPCTATRAGTACSWPCAALITSRTTTRTGATATCCEFGGPLRTEDLVARTNALVVAEHVLPTPELEHALREGGFDVRHASPAELADRAAPADLVLISASLGVRRVGLVAERFAKQAKRPTVVV